MKADRYYDVTCCRCGRSRSTDFEKGMEQGREYLLKVAKREGWKEDKTSGRPVCPLCVAMPSTGSL